MKKSNLKYRMYGLVNYQLSGTVHAGIQFGHAVVEYAQKYYKDDSYQSWAKNDKTFIILNGGITNDSMDLGMQGHLSALKSMKIKHAAFREPDLNNALTAIVFLVDERVYAGPTKAAFMKEMLVNDDVRLFKITEKIWANNIMGGKQNAFLKEMLNGLKLI